jgi:RNA polymerase sigma factor (sigma-70 family)
MISTSPNTSTNGYGTPILLADLAVPPIEADEIKQTLAHHHAAAFGWALACCKWDRAFADDVLQNAYLKILDGRAKHEGQSGFRTFLFGVIRLTAKEERRRHVLRSVLPFRASQRDIAAQPSDGLTLVIEDERSRQLGHALKQLPRRQREILHLVFYQDLTIASAAEIMAISVGSARSHYERGKATLRRLLDLTGQ